MSCWVVPALAAEYLGESIEQVMHKIREGLIASRTEHGFVVVDVAPGSPRQSTTKKTVYPPAPMSPVPGNSTPMHESQLPYAVEELSETIERDAFGDYRAARLATARLRKPPLHG